MSKIRIIRYSGELQKIWDEFVSRSRNATFLFYRNYMDYHSDRFKDHSLLVYNDEKLIALFPANIEGEVLCSHCGLTYGGFLTNREMSVPLMLKTFEAFFEYCSKNGIEKVVYKTIPYIYSDVPSEEDSYALFYFGAELIRRQVSTTVFLEDYKLNYKRKNGYNKAIKSGIVLKESDDLKDFFEIVKVNLNNKYGVKPAHTYEEMSMLKERFPENIKFFGAYSNDELLGGAVVYQNKRTAHLQYLHVSENGKRYRTGDFIVVKLLSEIYKDYKFFDFGHSTEDGGKTLNENLIKFKESFGGFAVCYDVYSININKSNG